MAGRTILAIEDEEDILELVSFNLHKEGFQVRGAGTGEEALRLARAAPPDLILLDLMLPGIDGLDVCRILKRDVSTREIPIVMVTAKGEEADIVAGLELGADDYITKPFSPKVLLARVRAVLRRREVVPGDDTAAIKAGNIVIDPGRRQVLVDDHPAALTFSEFQILLLLARRTGWVFTRYQIVDAVRGEDYAVTERSVDVHIAALRKKLGSAGDSIETVRGVGYRFKG